MRAAFDLLATIENHGVRRLPHSRLESALVSGLNFPLDAAAPFLQVRAI